MKLKLILSIIIAITFAVNFSHAQIKNYDDFSLKAMPGWVWGNLEMSYSHDQDNLENGFADIVADREIKGGEFIGKITKVQPMLFTAGNFISLMLLGVENDVNIVVSIIYDIDMNNRYDEESDVLLVSNPISINFNGWKEIKIKLDQENFNLITLIEEDFTITETDAYALNIDFIAGKNYNRSSFHSGIALLSEIQNIETFEQSSYSSNLSPEESFFKAKNYPNPFNPATTISYTLQEATHVSLIVYDRLGREVQALVNENKSSGTHTVEFNADSMPSGIYFYRIKTPAHTEVMKMILAK